MDTTDLDRLAAAQAARLDAREDPPPPPVLPPQTVEVVFDRRLVIETVTEGGNGAGGTLRTARRWKILDGAGAEVHPQEIAAVFLCAADMIASSQGWPPGLWRAARHVVQVAQEAAREASRVPPGTVRS